MIAAGEEQYAASVSGGSVRDKMKNPKSKSETHLKQKQGPSGEWNAFNSETDSDPQIISRLHQQPCTRHQQCCRSFAAIASDLVTGERSSSVNPRNFVFLNCFDYILFSWNMETWLGEFFLKSFLTKSNLYDSPDSWFVACLCRFQRPSALGTTLVNINEPFKQTTGKALGDFLIPERVSRFRSPSEGRAALFDLLGLQTG